jgi:hypothetical protein
MGPAHLHSVSNRWVLLSTGISSFQGGAALVLVLVLVRGRMNGGPPLLRAAVVSASLCVVCARGDQGVELSWLS